MNSNILIVDDEEDICSLIQGILEDEGYETCTASSSSEAYEQINAQMPALIILDIWLQGSEHDGLEILENVNKENENLPVIMISGHGTIETAVSSIKQGAYDFIEKPFKSDRLLLMIKRALETAELKKENEALRQKTQNTLLADLIGDSPATQNLKHVLQRVAGTNSRVLLTGEAGSGKEIAAQLIYKNSSRAENSFLTLNCATLRPERLEIELFGATKDIEGKAKTGLFEQAHEGTLLFDEIADMPLETQGKIVRVLQEQKFQKLGSDSFTQTDVRILASTNKNLEELVKSGKFREDLFYRLNVVPVHIPALRDRIEDIPALVTYFIGQIHQESGLPIQKCSKEALSLMQSYDWPGNVRQLKNVLEWALIMNAGQGSQTIEVDGLPPEIHQNSQGIVNIGKESNDAGKSYIDFSLKDAREMFEREYLDAQVKRFKGNISQTAQFVGMERSALHRKIKSLQEPTSDKNSKAEPINKTSRKRA